MPPTTTGPRTASTPTFHDFFTKYDFANDPRYVTLIVTDYGTFQGAGSSDAVPVKYFAGFYITGWDKIGNNPAVRG